MVKLTGFAVLLHSIWYNCCSNNLKGRQVLTWPVALEENVGKSQNGTIPCLYLLLLATYCKKEMTQKRNWPGCK